MEIKGNLKQVHPIIIRGEKNFESRKVWLDTETDGKYPQVIEIEVSGEKIGLFDGVSVGAPVNCHINLRGKLAMCKDGIERVFNTLQCWKVEAAGSQQAPPAPASQQGFPVEELPDNGDLPF